tara:strand:+ start:197 stop:1732 length:1536 start_codon:yes stop_codon:yes gene_type:complete
MATQKDRRITPQEDILRYSYGSNDLGAKNIFKERQRYNNTIFPPDRIKNSISTWNTDRFYGIVSTKGNTVTVDQKYLKPMRYSGDTQFVLNFVADAWRDFAERVRSLGNQNLIYKDSPWFDPKVIKAWTPASAKYDNYMREDVYSVFNTTFLPLGGKDRRITDIDSFLSVFDEYIDMVVSLVGPITFSGFLEGGIMSPLTSGLMLEIGSQNPSEDFPKSYEYLDENFELIAYIAAQYGFMIDRNVPWRLVADLRSEAMQEYMYGVPIEEFDSANVVTECDPTLQDPELAPMAFGYSQVPGMEDVVRRIAVHFDENGEPQPGYQEFQSVKDASSQQQVFDILFSTAYDETWNSDADNLQTYLINFYNTYVATLPVVSVREDFVHVDCVPETEVIERRQIDESEFEASFGERWKLKTFYVSRLVERDPERSTSLRRRELQKIMNIYNLSTRNPYDRALRFIQEEYIGPYDTDPLTISTVGDIIEADPRFRRAESVNDFSNPRRQIGLRRNLYS